MINVTTFLMEFSEVVSKRKSIRWFLDRNVTENTIQTLLEEASKSPSFMNHQPWEVNIVRGDTLMKVIELLDNDKNYHPEIPWPPKWPLRHQKLIDENRASAAKRILPEKGIGKWNYNAPVILYLHIHRELNEWSIFDLGAFAQTLMLSAANIGLSTVPQARLIMHGQKILKILGLPKERKLILGISLGYADMEHPNNKNQTKRAKLSEWVF